MPGAFSVVGAAVLAIVSFGPWVRVTVALLVAGSDSLESAVAVLRMLVLASKVA